MAQNLPYSDMSMTYDYSSHRYVLTADHVRNVLNINLENRLNAHGSADIGTLVLTYLKKISREIYTFIYLHNDPLLLEYIISKTETGRRVIKEMMEEQLLYWLANGDVGVLSGLSHKNGKYLERTDIKRTIVSPIAEMIANSTAIPETGCTLTYIGRYSIMIDLPKYEEEKY